MLEELRMRRRGGPPAPHAFLSRAGQQHEGRHALMTADRPEQGKPTPQDMVATAEWHLAASVRALETLIRKLEAEEAVSGRDFADRISSLRKAVEIAFNERSRLFKLTGARDDVPDPALDLARARDEIGRRMARLRAAGNGGGVSGQSE